MNNEYDKDSLHNCEIPRWRPKYKEHPTTSTTQFLMTWLRNCIVLDEYEISFLPIILLQDQINTLLLNVTYMVQEDTVSNINTDTSLEVMYYLRNEIHSYTLEARNYFRKEEKRKIISIPTRTPW